MSARPGALRTVQLERYIPAPPAQVWRSLTESRLIAEWFMQNDFQPLPGHRFTLRAEPLPHWNGVADCQVLLVEPAQELMFSWNASAEEAARGPNTVVHWTLRAEGAGTRVQLAQSGFRVEEGGRAQAAAQHWPGFLQALERVVLTLEAELESERDQRGPEVT